MNRKEQWIGWGDIAHAALEFAAETAINGLKAVFRMPQPFATHGDHLFEHKNDPQLELPMYYHDVTSAPNRWDSEGRYFED